MDETVARFVDEEKWIVDNSAVGDEETYQKEMRRVFGTCWLYVGHESQIPDAGSFITNYMGEDSVIVTRSDDGKVHVMLNKCRHRGNRLCLYDRGNAPFFKCSYHGWCYNPKGELYSAPMLREAYFNELDRDSLGLVEAQVGTYRGFIFASWNPKESLEDYLGEVRWYFDRFLLSTDEEGLEIAAGVHRFRMSGNWKLLAENFAGDHYHFATSHESVLLVYGRRASEENRYLVATNHYSNGAGHSINALFLDDKHYKADLKAAEELGPEAKAWVEQRRQRVLAANEDLPVKPSGFGGGTIFPNLSLIEAGTALHATGLLQWHPCGPFEIEVWQWALIEKSAPEIVKREMVSQLLHNQSVAGLVGPDDGENFERIVLNTRTTVARTVPFHYAMGVGHEDVGTERGIPEIESFPGLVAPAVTETAQRQFYRHWVSVMTEED